MAIQRTFDTFLTLSEINGRLFIINIPRPFWTVSIVAPVCGGFFPFLVFCSFLCPFHHYFFLLLPPVQINCSSKTPPAGWTTSLCSFQPFFSSHPSIPASHPSSIIVFCCPSLIVQNLYVKLCKPYFFFPPVLFFLFISMCFYCCGSNKVRSVGRRCGFPLWLLYEMLLTFREVKASFCSSSV